MQLIFALATFTLLAKFKEVVWLLPPGTAIAVLALVAGVTAVTPVQRLKPWVRAIVVVISILLVVLEISVLTHSRDEALWDRKAQDVLHKKEISEVLAHFTFVEQALNDLHINSIRARAQNSTSPLSLKRRVLDLSDEILQFLVNRQIAPGYGQGGFGEGGYGGTAVDDEAYQRQTVVMFTGAFQGRVTAIREALAKQGLTDRQLDAECQNPINAYSIRTIAERIGALAEKLPQ
jgi:hypothetical protein